MVAAPAAARTWRASAGRPPRGGGRRSSRSRRLLADLAGVAQPAIEAARQDKLAWIAYPKAGQLGTDLSRDSLARWVQDHGIRPVRQIALDEVWSALRFRPAR